MDKIYYCKLSNSKICYTIYDIDELNKIALINFEYINWKECKLFILLLKKSIEELKDLGVIKIRQNVTLNDWSDILNKKTSWIINNTNNDILLIECDLNDFLNNFRIGIGL
jgi:hypothetical protein